MSSPGQDYTKFACVHRYACITVIHCGTWLDAARSLVSAATALVSAATSSKRLPRRCPSATSANRCCRVRGVCVRVRVCVWLNNDMEKEDEMGRRAFWHKGCIFIFRGAGKHSKRKNAYIKL